MECFHARELIQEKLEGSLDARLEPKLEAHLINCHECRDFEQGIETLNTLLSREPLEEVPEGFSTRVAEAAARRRRKILTYERKNLRVAAACVATVLAALLLLPYFISIPDPATMKEELLAMTPVLPDSSNLPNSLSDLAPQIPETSPILTSAANQLKDSWDSLSTVQIPSLGLTGMLFFMLAALAAVAAAFEAVYFALPYRRRK